MSGAAPETEIAIYAKIGDMHGLESCVRKEHHIQLESSFANGVPVRVRKTIRPEGTTFSHCFKLNDGKRAGVMMRKEYPAVVDEDYFEGFKAVAKRALVKTRYIFESTSVSMSLVKENITKRVVMPKILYEVDVFEMQNGAPCEWCKIDVELDGMLEFLRVHEPGLKDYNLNIRVSHLPFKPLSPILSTDQSQRGVLDSIWRQYHRMVGGCDNKIPL